MARGNKKVNMSLVNNQLTRNRAFQKEVLQIAEKKIDASRLKLLNDFDEHPVTREIRGGVDARNISNTLGGYGNLFTFIGFAFGSDPIGPVRRMLHQIKAKELKKKLVSKRKIRYEVELSVPSKEAIAAMTPLPFENGRSWLYGIESGISGFGAYMYKKWKTSRSGHGIQVDKKLRSGSFRNTQYFSNMLLKFVTRIR